ncbi:hypothetical protein LINGRAHAP2_LOCUS8939 [Linum grandiflorum]
MSARDESDSDAPEEFTAGQGIELDAEIRKIQKENKSRVTREGKERRRKWAERKTPRPSKEGDKEVKDTVETAEEEDDESASAKGMLPNSIVQLLAAREKKVFSAESDDDEKTGSGTKLHPRKKKARGSGPHTVILNEISPPPCVQNSLEFLKKNKMRVARSSAVLNNSNQALRLISASGLLSNK